MANRRTKVLIVCGTLEKQAEEYLEWATVIEEHLGKKAKMRTPERRIETPFAIIDFVWEKPIYAGNYKVILNTGEDEEKILRLAIGEDTD